MKEEFRINKGKGEEILAQHLAQEELTKTSTLLWHLKIWMS